MKVSLVILAAGQGTRMRSTVPKVLHRIGGRPLLAHVVATAAQLAGGDQRDADIHVVYGHGGEQVREALPDYKVDWVHQQEQLGTGHAVQHAMEHIDAERQVLILYGDVPLLSAATLQRLLAASAGEALALLTVTLEDPVGYGRIVRDAQGGVRAIVEEKDASDAQRAIREVNTGIMAVPAARLRGWLSALDNDNAQREYYLTDIIAMAVAEHVAVRTVEAGDPDEVMGVNDRVQLNHLERVYQRRRAETLMRAGVTLADAARLDVRGAVTAGQDSFIDVNVVLEGEVTLGERVAIGPNCVLRDVTLGDDVQVLANSVIEAARIGDGARIGPFARIRPETVIGAHAHIGNFVEIKKAAIGSASKVNHLSYIGDSEIGREVNIGAGTITCNYDGANKHRTVIEDEAFIGSDCQLIAPVTIGRGATIGAGSTITSDAPPGELTLSRAAQKNIRGWKRPVRNRN